MVIDLTEENGSEWKIDGMKEVFKEEMWRVFLPCQLWMR